MDPKWWCESKTSKLRGHRPKKTPLSKDLWAKELSDERSLIVPWRQHPGVPGGEFDDHFDCKKWWCLKFEFPNLAF